MFNDKNEKLLYEVSNKTTTEVSGKDEYVTYDSSFWAAMTSRDIFPIRISLFAKSIKIEYERKAVAEYIGLISAGSANIEELDALGTIIKWKAVIGVLKMLYKYKIDFENNEAADPENKKDIYANTTDQNTILSLSFRNINPVYVINVSGLSCFCYSRESIAEIEEFFFFPWKGTQSDYAIMKDQWHFTKSSRRAGTK